MDSHLHLSFISREEVIESKVQDNSDYWKESDKVPPLENDVDSLKSPVMFDNMYMY